MFFSKSKIFQKMIDDRHFTYGVLSGKSSEKEKMMLNFQSKSCVEILSSIIKLLTPGLNLFLMPYALVVVFVFLSILSTKQKNTKNNNQFQKFEKICFKLVF